MRSLSKKTLKVAVSIAVMVVTITCMIVTTFAWYTSEIRGVYQLDVDASGFLTLYLEVPVDKIGDNTGRDLFPAVAMPGAVTNGLRLDPLVVYDKNSPNPSYVSKATVARTYENMFSLKQAMGQNVDVEYRITVRSKPDVSGIIFDLSEFLFSEVAFSYTESKENTEVGKPPIITTINPIKSQSADKTNGIMNIADAQNVTFKVTMSLAQVDELMDANMMNTSIWVEIALKALVII